MTNLKINLSKKACIIWGTILGIFLILGIYQLRHPMIFRYEKDYFGKVGLPRAKLYESVVEKMGEPLRIEEKNDWGYVVHYDGLELGYPCIELGALEYVKVTGNQYRFGMWRIGVGSTRKKVESVYRHIKKIHGMRDNEVGVIDGLRWVTYVFDENDIVKEIYLSNGL